MKNNLFKGTGVALVTPFNQDKSIDFSSLERLVNEVIEQGVDFLVALGTTSEAATLNADEKKQVLDTIIKVNNKRCPLVLGMGGNNTEDLVSTIKNTDFEGVDGLLSVAPYYNKPSQRGVLAHFSVIAESTDLPIILYNVPGRTSSNIDADTVLTLSKKYKNIVAVKEASSNFSQIMKIIQNKPEDFVVLSGDDNLTLPLISVGMEGVISVSANLYPDKMSQMVRLSMNNQFEEARQIHYQTLNITDYLFQEGNPAGVKSALYHKGVIANPTLRLPLVEVSEELDQKIKDSLL